MLKIYYLNNVNLQLIYDIVWYKIYSVKFILSKRRKLGENEFLLISYFFKATLYSN